MKTSRLMGILVILLEHQKGSAPELARRFEVSVRTIHRDMEALAQGGIPLYATTGNQGGYALMDQFRIHHRLFAPQDFLRIIQALEGMQGAFSDQRFRCALELMASLAPEAVRREARESQGRLRVDLGLGPDSSVLGSKARTLDRALEERRPVAFGYTSHRGETLSRIVEPISLVFQWGHWYLYAFCRTRLDYRLFRLSRIQNLEVLEENFATHAKSFEDFMAERPDFDHPRLVDLVFRVVPGLRASVEEFHRAEELTYLPDGTVEVRTRQPEEDRLYRYLLSYGDGIEIVDPPAVRAQVRALAEKIVEKIQA